MASMALVVFFRGINVGGHRSFRPSLLAKELSIYDAVNFGAPATTRSWSTILSVLRILKSDEPSARSQ
jgi:hypothetical protein